MMRSCASVVERVPFLQIVKILLHNHVASAAERCIFFADQHRVNRRVASRVFRAIHEPIKSRSSK